jgi:hypothetical protein
VRADLSRRSVLAATAMTVPLVAVGCKGVGGLGTRPTAAPDVALLDAAILTEQTLIARYQSALAGTPGLAATLTPILAQHREHLARLRSMLIVPPGSRATAEAAPSAPAGTTAAPATLAVLEADETAAARSQTGRLAAAPPALAQLLASIAASEASHALLLRMDRATG